MERRALHQKVGLSFMPSVFSLLPHTHKGQLKVTAPASLGDKRPEILPGGKTTPRRRRTKPAKGIFGARTWKGKIVVDNVQLGR